MSEEEVVKMGHIECSVCVFSEQWKNYFDFEMRDLLICIVKSEPVCST